ncbi:NAD(P)/FAD-dependent oxidoreductase [Conexibacter sp. JD483]|uniref:dihydrolipoyl dehydrogenase family protein n=1 Tax=unclassified Conexibacter TaxID=2627773 RepID=UPI00271CC506|nr:MULTISPECIES: NAD(P)/FAD-dependent oxidoreductase [unclassified Conexibacter]MDO8185422.1 NAD(P)/FAD-dependent oxidoreductase [Conexibacter sp. CPCC 205706]MDO8198402.1 NAD(P)/FAD-dependent oxidoreductase [Conexibacter sp. CPCC 205762]MDR9369364.1 NAD(P)/FAD-dependent oxidoreductase [Conexibacter sp. JD483]
MTSARSFDAIVIGAGPAGEVAAGKLAGRGLATALVERELVGGECAYYACMPSKALLRPGELADETRRVQGVEDAGVETIPALRRRDEVIHELDDSVQLPWVEKKGIALFRGSARLDGERRVRVATSDGGEQLLEATRAVVLAVGSRAAIPPVPGLRELEPWTNREITTARQVPPRLLILGGGVVGVEMAQAWAGYGTQVTLVEAGERLIAQEEQLASEQVADALRRRGVDVRLGARAAAARREPADAVSVLTLESGEELRAEVLVVATGREPRTDALGLESVGLEPGKTIDVDDTLRVPGKPWLFAIGDCNGRELLTHQGKLQARVVAAQVAGDERPSALHSIGPPPRVIFTDPQVAAVGHTAETAARAGLDVELVDARIDKTAAASFHGKGQEQHARFVVDRARRVLLGATFVGAEVSEFVHAASIAVVGEVPVERIAQVAAPFPTRSEVWIELADWAESR